MMGSGNVQFSDLKGHASKSTVVASGEHDTELETCPSLGSLTNPETVFEFFEDFIGTPNSSGVPTGWAVTADAGSTGGQAVADRRGGWWDIYTDGDDNDEAYASTVNECFTFETGKDLWFQARVQPDEVTSGDGSFVIGLSDTVGANTIVDAGTLATSFDGAVFFKGEDDTVWSIASSNATAQDIDETSVAWSDNTAIILGFYFDADGGAADGDGRINYFIDGVFVGYQDITLSGLAEMHVLLGAKTHGAEEQVLKVDYVKVVQER